MTDHDNPILTEEDKQEILDATPEERYALEMLHAVMYKPGESALEYMERTTQYMVQEAARMALDQSGKTTDRVKLDAIKLWLDRQIPVKTIHQINQDEEKFSRLSDKQVEQLLTEHLDELKPNALPEPANEPDEPTE
jgi:hypothetical protein